MTKTGCVFQIPNPLFDLAGITCGHFLVPFWTFFGATLIGKAIIKMHIQVCFFLFFLITKHHFASSYTTSFHKKEIKKERKPNLQQQVDSWAYEQNFLFASERLILKRIQRRGEKECSYRWLIHIKQPENVWESWHQTHRAHIRSVWPWESPQHTPLLSAGIPHSAF